MAGGGTKYDGGKTRLDLVPVTLTEGVGEVLTFGAQKYSAHNWRQGIAYSRILGSIERHYSEFKRGIDIDPESGLSHLKHLACNVAFLLEFEEYRDTLYKGLDDRWIPGVGLSNGGTSNVTGLSNKKA